MCKVGVLNIAPATYEQDHPFIVGYIASGGCCCTKVIDKRVYCLLGFAAKTNHVVHIILVFVVVAA